MIGNESRNFLRENDHPHNEHDRCPKRARESQRKAARHRCERAHNRGQGCGDAGALLHPFSPLPAIPCFRVHFFLAYFSEASILLLNSLVLAITAASSTVSSFLSRITTRPLMITVSTSLPFNAYASCA